MKTIEEGFGEYLKEDLENDSLLDFYKAGASFAHRWIPVEEKLPESNIPVLVKDCFGAFRVAFCIGSLNLWSCNNITDGKVTHWKPIELK